MNKENKKNKYISDNIFEEDNAVFKLISMFEAGEVNFKLATSFDQVIRDAKIVRNDTGEFILKFKLQEDSDSSFRMEHFFKRPVILAALGAQIIIRNVDVTKFKQFIGGKKQKAEVFFNAFRGDLDDSIWDNSKQSAYYRFNCNEFNVDSSSIIYDITTKTDQSSSWKNGVSLKIDKSLILFYYLKMDTNIGYFVFKTNDAINHAKFLHIINSIRAAFSLITGFYIGDSAYYISMQKGKTNTFTYRYENINKTINSNRPLLDNLYYNDISQDKLSLTSEQFQQLTSLLYKNEELLRSCILLTEASDISGLSKACLAAVALETITNNISIKENRMKKLIDNNEIYSQLKYELNKGLEKIKNQIDKGTFEILKSKLGKLNEQSNTTKLGTPFTKLGISLTKEDEYCISCRNYLLHGSMPKSKSLIFKNLNEEELLQLISYRLIMLSSMLILKQIDYSNYIIDWGYTEIIMKRKMMNNESIQGSGRLHRLISN